MLLGGYCCKAAKWRHCMWLFPHVWYSPAKLDVREDKAAICNNPQGLEELGHGRVVDTIKSLYARDSAAVRSCYAYQI